MKYALQGGQGTFILRNQSQLFLLMPKYSFCLYFCRFVFKESDVNIYYEI